MHYGKYLPGTSGGDAPAFDEVSGARGNAYSLRSPCLARGDDVCSSQERWAYCPGTTGAGGMGDPSSPAYQRRGVGLTHVGGGMAMHRVCVPPGTLDQVAVTLPP